MLRKVMSAVITSAMLICFSTTVVYGQDKVVDVKTGGESTYFITDNGDLYVNNEDATVTKIASNVKELLSGSLVNFDLSYIGTDGVLYVIFNVSEDDVSEAYVLMENVKDANFSYDDDYIVKSDGSLYAASIGYDLSSGDFVPDIEETLITTGVKEIESSSYDNNLAIIKEDNSLWFYSEGSFFGYDSDLVFNEPKKIMDNVKSVTLTNFNAYVIDSKGNLILISDDDFKNGKFSGGELLESGVSYFAYRNDDNYDYENNSNFIIKTDNTLWVKGNSSNGSMGLGEGVEKAEDYVKIADNVVDIASSSSHTVYLNKDGKIYGMGNNGNGQLGTAKGDGTVYVDENGAFEIMTGVSSADINSYVTTIIKEDNTLWGIGKNTYNIITDEEVEKVEQPVKIADNVSYGKYDDELGTITYISSEDNKIHFRGLEEYSLDSASDEIAEEHNDKLMKYFIELMGLDTKNYLLYFEDEKKLAELEKKYDALSELEVNKIDKAIEDYEKKLTEEYLNKFSDSYGKDAVITSGNYYINKNNELYEIDFLNGEKKLADNMKYVVEYQNRFLLAIGKDDNLYYAKLYDVNTYTIAGDYDWDKAKKDYGKNAHVNESKVYENNEGKTVSEVEVYTKLDNIVFEKLDIGKVKGLDTKFTRFTVLTTDGKLIRLEELDDYAYFDKNGAIKGVVTFSDDGTFTGENFYEKTFTFDELSKFNELKIENATETEYGYVSLYKEIDDSKHYKNSVDVYNEEELIKIDNLTYCVNELNNEKEVKTFADSNHFTVYVDTNDVLWGFGSNFKNPISAKGEHFETPVLIAEDVKSVYADGTTTLILKNDGTLFGMGSNVYGELGFKAQGEGYSVYNIYKPTEVIFVK